MLSIFLLQNWGTNAKRIRKTTRYFKTPLVVKEYLTGTSLSCCHHPKSVAPNASQDKAGRSNFPHLAIRATPGENAEKTEIVDVLSFHMKNRGLTLRNSAARTMRKIRKIWTAKTRKFRNAGDWLRRKNRAQRLTFWAWRLLGSSSLRGGRKVCSLP